MGRPPTCRGGEVSETSNGLSRRDRWLGSIFGRLGKGVVHHPWYTLLFWVVILLVSIPAAANLSSVISSSFGNTIPNGDGSVVAQAQFAAQFPNSSAAPSSALVLLEAPQITGPVGMNATLAVASGIASDRNITEVSSVTTVYSAYAAYLTGEAELGMQFLQPVKVSLPASVNQTAEELWGPIALYVQNWESVDRSLPNGTPASQANWPAYNETETAFRGQPLGHEIVSYFYLGDGLTLPGFNRTVSASCLDSANVTPCADEAARTTLPHPIAVLFPGRGNATAALIVLGGLGLENLTSWSAVQRTSATVLGAETGLDPAWALTLWQQFPGNAAPSPAALGEWASTIADTTPIARYPLPIPSTLYGTFVNPADSATLIVVSFAVSDSVDSNGSSLTYQDVQSMGTVVGRVLDSTPADGGIRDYVTGQAALDGATTDLANSAIGTLLVLTIVVLIAIMIIYFRAPAALSSRSGRSASRSP